MVWRYVLYINSFFRHWRNIFDLWISWETIARIINIQVYYYYWITILFRKVKSEFIWIGQWCGIECNGTFQILLSVNIRFQFTMAHPCNLFLGSYQLYEPVWWQFRVSSILWKYNEVFVSCTCLLFPCCINVIIFSMTNNMIYSKLPCVKFTFFKTERLV